MDAYLRILNSPRLLLFNSTRLPVSSFPVSAPPFNRAEFCHPIHSSPIKKSSSRRCTRRLSGSDFHHADSNSVFFPRFSSKDINGESVRLAGSKNTSVMVVLLGWLGARRRHMKKYADFYNSNGFDAVTFVVPVTDLLWFDFGKRLEKRILDLSDVLSSWISQADQDGHDRHLLFHTFSNTGWFVYGVILEKFQRKQNLVEKVRGCIVDSGGDPELNPEVWAAGFSAALLKKSTSPREEGKEWSMMEPLLLSTLDPFFFLILKLPNVKRRLGEIIAVLRKHQPGCPQLYLYSTEDRVIPHHAIEMFMEGQRQEGRDVWCFNFQSSPHVHHFRTFPELYRSQLSKFIAHCLVAKADTSGDHNTS